MQWQWQSRLLKFVSHKLWTSKAKLWTSQMLDFDPFDNQQCYFTFLSEMFRVNYPVGKYKHSAAPLMPSIVVCIFLWGS